MLDRTTRTPAATRLDAHQGSVHGGVQGADRGHAGLAEWLRPRTGTGTGPASAPALVRAAFVGRVSTDEQQDPTLSLPRQVASCQSALLPGMAIVAYFYDVESSRKELDQRGHSTAWQKFDITVPRDGGLADLLIEALRPDRRFDVVICESIDRIARYTHQGTKIEHDLELAGVPLLAADEPIILDGQTNGRPRKRASQVLLRRTKQGVAEWYILEMLEKSWDGFAVHTSQGWNIGKPPYGYLPAIHKHPVPAKRAQGKHKTRLAVDPVRGPVVEHIYALRIDQELSYRAIAEYLNTDLDRFPPPQPVDPERAVGRWTGSAVREILCNPKYSGYMVWNRRSTKDKRNPGKNNPRESWVTSEHPTHPPLVSLDRFLQAQHLGRRTQGSRSDHAAPSINTHPQTRHSYRLRSYVSCARCQRRMHGKTKGKNSYYYCQPRERRIPDGHPPSLWLPERHIITGLTSFFNAHLFGPDRAALLHRAIDTTQQQTALDHQDKITAIRRGLADTDTRLARLTTILEERDDPTGAVFTRIQTRLAELDQQRARQHAELAALDAETPHHPVESLDLLDLLPHLTLNLENLPADRLRNLLGAFHIHIDYDHTTNQITYHAKLSTHTIPGANELATSLAKTAHNPPTNANRSQPMTNLSHPPTPTRKLHSSFPCPAGGTSQNYKSIRLTAGSASTGPRTVRLEWSAAPDGWSGARPRPGTACGSLEVPGVYGSASTLWPAPRRGGAAHGLRSVRSQ